MKTVFIITNIAILYGVSLFIMLKGVDIAFDLYEKLKMKECAA
jgi:hypothetical protein